MIVIRSVVLFLLIAFYISAGYLNGQNTADKYDEAYKKYVTAACPIAKDNIQHFVYFARDREAITGHPLLEHPMFRGAQIMYSWRDFETERGVYDFSILKEDYEYLKKYGKKVF